MLVQQPRQGRGVRWRSVASLSAAAALLLVSASASPAQAASGGPPYTQCPAVNYSPSCQILLTAQPDGSITVDQDGSVGQYDGGDDTLVGVVNRSSVPVEAITVSGPGSNLAGFDYDGLCAYNGCGYGPTGYEGPGTSFVTTPSSRDVAEVDFTPALTPGATGYFSLEGALTKASLTVRTGHLDGGGQAVNQIVYVHGITETAGQDSFGTLLDPIRKRFGAATINDFPYYQDKSAAAGGPCAAGPAPDASGDTVGLPLDTSGNSASVCDSAGDLGQNVVKLDQFVRDTYARNGKKVILVGYSMGAALIRGVLAYSQATGDGALGKLDSIMTIHGVEQGSWIAGVGLTLSGTPLLGGPIDSLIGKLFVDPRRPAITGLAPQHPYVNWVNGHSGALPDLPYYNAFGDQREAIGHCFLLFHQACTNTDIMQWGDLVILPGTDRATDTPADGGTRFAPAGYTDHTWQFAETARVVWDPVNDPTEISALDALYRAPQTHLNITSQQSSVMVNDCKTGAPIPIDRELQNILNERLQGHLYACDPANKP